MRRLLLACLLLVGCSGKKEPQPENDPPARHKDSQQEQQPKEEAAFNPSSIDKTLAWFAGVVAPVAIRDGNELTAAQRRKAAQVTLDQMKGQKVRWWIAVRYISAAADKQALIHLDNVSVNASSERMAVLKVYSGDAAGALDIFAWELGPTPGLKVPADAWVAELRKGQNVLVEGTVQRVAFTLHNPEDGQVSKPTAFLGIVLRDWKISRP